MTALEYLKSIPREWLPKSFVHGVSPPSNSELFRWLRNGSVIINGARPKPTEEIELPITKLVFFPTSGRKTTMVKDEQE